MMKRRECSVGKKPGKKEQEEKEQNPESYTSDRSYLFFVVLLQFNGRRHEALKSRRQAKM